MKGKLMFPDIGIVICGIDNGRQFVSCPYVEVIQESGGLPLIIPYTKSSEDFKRYLAVCDGFLFCGGNDVTPLLFDEELLTEKGITDWSLDVFHLEFMKFVLDSKLPTLAICRGMQVMNLALGGNIYQDLTLLEHAHLNHSQASQKRSDPSHKITISKSSLLYGSCGSSALVNSFHHQCVNSLGSGLRITAVASDGVIEAIEFPSHPFALGVQWHPECMYKTNASMQNLFLQFIDAAKKAKNITLI
ncbi:MAG: gamma-glutamyl-gamma-aminobutyrate hydrolase family protein [Dorea sp.]